MPCKNCGSYAINPDHHGRDGTDLDLCDVCYWRKRAEGKDVERLEKELQQLTRYSDYLMSLTHISREDFEVAAKVAGGK